ncbi:MAG: hypothetical protein AAGI11_16725 [Pseudomonadota bacterium]
MSNNDADDDRGAYRNQIEYPSPFDDLAVEICKEARRHICILSAQLDHRVFDRSEFIDVVSKLARRGRESQIRILVADAEPIVQRGHRLLKLARRLPSAVKMQKLAEHPSWRGETLVIRDSDGVLCLPMDGEQKAFYEPDSKPRAGQHLQLFNELWRQSGPDVNFRSLPL